MRGFSAVLLAAFLGAACSSDGGSRCEETCSYAMDGECDDGGPGSLYSGCEFGTDCTDCGPRRVGVSPEPSCSEAGSACASRDECCSSVCAAETETCLATCQLDSECSSGCCRPLEAGGGACYPAEFCN